MDIVNRESMLWPILSATAMMKHLQNNQHHTKYWHWIAVKVCMYFLGLSAHATYNQKLSIAHSAKKRQCP